MPEPVVGLLDQVWSSIEELCAELTPAQWSRPTDCPGWSVKDNLSHLCGMESRLLGRKQPQPVDPSPEHVRNPLGALNEAHILERRSWDPEDVLTEFMELTAERLKIISEMTDQEMAAQTDSPLGKVSMRDVLAIRLVDCFYHEQDIRRAVGIPGGFEDPTTAVFVYRRLAAALPMIVGKKAALADGSSVVVDVEGAGRTSLEVAGGRANPRDDSQGPPTATIRMDLETFLCLAGGRWTPERAGDRVKVEGDSAVADAVLASMNVLF